MFPRFDPRAELLPRRIYTLVKCGRQFRVPYLPAAWQALVASGEYGEDFFAFLGRFLAALREAEWPAGSYFPGGWYRVLLARGQDPARVPITPHALGPFYGDEVRVDEAGVWTVGRKIITGAVLQFFLRNLHFDPELQRYVIRYDLESYVETRYIHHESLPLRILALEGDPAGPWVHANDGTREPLRWDTLRMDAAEQVYCAVRPERLPAQFADGPRFRLLDRLTERPTERSEDRSGVREGERAWERAGEWAVRWGEREHTLNLAAPWPGAASLEPLPPAESPDEGRAEDERDAP